MSARGFTAIPNHILRDKDLPASTRLLYGVILSYAFGSRTCTASAERLAEETGISRAAFFMGIRTLREHGYIEVTKKKSANGWRNVYRPVILGIEVSDAEEGSPEPGQRVVHEVDGGSSTTRTQKKSSTEEEESPTDVGDRAREQPRVTFGGKTVPADVAAEAITALQAWAEKTGQTLSPFTGRGKPSESLTRIVGAMLDYPEVLVWWPQMIDQALAAPWWEGIAPGIGVVFGPKVVEKSLSMAKSPAQPHGATARRNGQSTPADYMALLTPEEGSA